jgi:glycosyltransferase involved in cell wall biosynthesis
VVLYSGNFETYQGVDLLVGAIADVAARVPGVRFVLVGGTREGVPGSSDQVAQLLNRGTLKVVGRRPREDMPGFLAMADVLVSPRCYGDNAPLKVFDYLRAGCPIVATDIVAHRPILADGRSLLVAPDAASIATGILRVLENPAEALALREGARRYADEHLRWDDFVAAGGVWYLEAQRAPARHRPVGGISYTNGGAASER